MKKFLYKGNVYNGKELAELTGVNYTTLMERIKRGYTVEEAVADINNRIPESVTEFVEKGEYWTWSGMTNAELYSWYRTWCANNSFEPETQIHFSRCLKKLIDIKITPTRVIRDDGVPTTKRIVRVIM